MAELVDEGGEISEEVRAVLSELVNDALTRLYREALAAGATQEDLRRILQERTKQIVEQD